MKNINNVDSPADEFSFLKIGDKIPAFTWLDSSGKKVASETMPGKKTLIILFTTNCRHCINNLTYIEKTLVQGSKMLNILAICRDSDSEQVEAYRISNNLTINLIPDPNRELFSKFAEKVVPRNYLFDSAGTLVMKTRGFRYEQVETMATLILMENNII